MDSLDLEAYFCIKDETQKFSSAVPFYHLHPHKQSIPNYTGLHLATKMWYFWWNYIDDLSLMWYDGCGYVGAAGFETFCSPEGPQYFSQLWSLAIM